MTITTIEQGLGALGAGQPASGKPHQGNVGDQAAAETDDPSHVEQIKAGPPSPSGSPRAARSAST